MTTELSDKVLDHFLNPRNVGIIENADGFGEHTSLTCGDLICLYLKVDNGRISNAKFLCSGCVGSIVSGSALTTLLQGKTIQDAETIGRDEILSVIGSLPEEKMHCPILAVEALRKAVRNYHSKVHEVNL